MGLKVNWDAPLNKKEGCIGLGIIARDSAGNFLVARCLTQKIMTDPHTAEAVATSCALSFRKVVGFFYVVFEGDALRVIREANSEYHIFHEVAIL